MDATRRRWGSPAVLVVAGIGTAVAWVAWMGWDDEYQVDPVTGIESGPYEPWQVIGSALTFALVVAAAAFLLRRDEPLSLVAASAAGYTLAFAVTVVPSDESGLSLVGVIMVAFGTGLASTVVVWVVRRLPARRRR